MQNRNGVTTHDYCERCASLRTSCCAADRKIPLTMRDIQRLASLGHDPESFVAIEHYDLDPRDHESWWVEGFPCLDGGRYRASMNCVGGSCPFLRHGCLLGSHRPLVCRIHPFWVDEGGQLIYLDDDCPLTAEKWELARSLRLMEETSASVLGLRDEIRWDFEHHRGEHEAYLRSRLKR